MVMIGKSSSSCHARNSRDFHKSGESEEVDWFAAPAQAEK